MKSFWMVDLILWLQDFMRNLPTCSYTTSHLFMLLNLPTQAKCYDNVGVFANLNITLNSKTLEIEVFKRWSFANFECS